MILPFVTFGFSFSQESEFDLSKIDTTEFHAKSWIFNQYIEKEYFDIDTSLNNYQLCQPFYNQSFYNFHLGGILSPSMPAVFIHQKKIIDDFIFLNFNQNNFTVPEEVKYYNTLKPYTDFFYSSFPTKLFETVLPTLPNEQLLQLIHTQNINSNTNVGLKYNLATEESMEASAASQNSSSNSLIFWGVHEGTRYSLHANVIFNKIKYLESGGIDDNASDYVESESNKYFLSDARSKITDNYIYLNQEYKIGKTDVEVVNDTTFIENFTEKGVLSHTLKVESAYFKYSEDDANLGFYNDIFIDSIKTSDSTDFTKINNLIQLKSNKYKLLGFEFKGRVAISNDIYRLYNFKDYISKNKPTFKTNTYVIAGVTNLSFKTFSSDFDIKYCMVGNNFADLEFNSNLFKVLPLKNDSVLLNLNFNYQHTEPSIFVQNYFSNHNKWENNFSKQKNISISLKFSKPKQFIDLEFNTSLIKDYIYFGANCEPAQNKGVINVNSVSLKKDIHFWKITLLNNIVYQNITNKEIISLPDFVLLNSTFADFSIFQNNLLLQIGFDIYYTTKFNLYSYNPSISVFYINDVERASGNYPIINPFVKFKLKTSLIFIQVDNAAAYFITDYYSHINNYHILEYYIRFGVKWWFTN